MGEHTDAGVLVPLVGDDLLFAVRSAESSTHATQVAFPGGKREPVDGSFCETALREFDEELTTPREAVTVLADLEPHSTRSSGFRILPFVARLPTTADPDPADGELAETFTVPISALYDRYEMDGDRVRYSLDGYEVWGVTARILTTVLLRRAASDAFPG